MLQFHFTSCYNDTARIKGSISQLMAATTWWLDRAIPIIFNNPNRTPKNNPIRLTNGWFIPGYGHKLLSFTVLHFFEVALAHRLKRTHGPQLTHCFFSRLGRAQSVSAQLVSIPWNLARARRPGRPSWKLFINAYPVKIYRNMWKTNMGHPGRTMTNDGFSQLCYLPRWVLWK